MMTGAPPFTGSTPLNVLTEHLTGVIEPPSKRSAEGRVSPALDRVVMHALARERDERYPSALALADAITRARSNPTDVGSVRPPAPPAPSAPPPGTDAFAVTLPSIGMMRSASRASAAVHPTADTVLAPPPSGPRSAPPPRTPSRAPSSGPARGASPSKNPSSAPPALSARPVIGDGSTRMWVLLWVLAGLASIGLGVYFALR
jgi:serine/threonine-protein kinase